MELATLKQNDILKLPIKIAKNFNIADKFMVWTEGDLLYLKRIKKTPLMAVKEAPKDIPINLDEINDIVHKVRKRKI